MDPSQPDVKTYQESKEVVDHAAPSEEYPRHVTSHTPPEYFYDFRNKKGVAVILNHFKYIKKFFRSVPPERDGTHADVQRLRATFTSLHFTVEDHTDLTYNQIIDVLQEVSRRDHSDTACLVVCVLTHGEAGGRLLAADRDYSTQDLFCHFTSDSCPPLARAPKLFFLQACRGKKMDDGVQLDSQTSDSIKLPTTANFLVMYSTVEDFVSWRQGDGSWFVQALCDELELRRGHMELLQILTLVNWRVAYQRTSFVPADPHQDGKKQMPQLVSTLTKLLRFNKD